MMQIVASLFFFAALLVPVAIITLTLERSWRPILRALGGEVADGPRLMLRARPRQDRHARPQPYREQGSRAAA